MLSGITNHVPQSSSTLRVGNKKQEKKESSCKKANEGIDKSSESKNSKVAGKTIGSPELSEKAAKYYEQLKKRYSDMEFILVSKDKMAEAKATASQYANPVKMVVLIDEEKIEKMAVDKEYREKYETIIGNAKKDLGTFKDKMQETPASPNGELKGYGIQVNDNGTVTYFATLEKMTAKQKERIKETVEKKREAAKVKEKESEKEEKEENEAVDHTQSEKIENNYEMVEYTVSASTVDELIQKVIESLKQEGVPKNNLPQDMNIGKHFDASF